MFYFQIILESYEIIPAVLDNIKVCISSRPYIEAKKFNQLIVKVLANCINDFLPFIM